MNRSLSILISALLLIAGCAEKETTETIERVTAVNAKIVSATEHDLTVEYTGTLEGLQQAVIYSKIAESVQRIRVSEGEEVFPGRVLIDLDKYGPTSHYQQARSLLSTSEKNFKKLDALFREGAISESQLDASRTEYEVNKASFEAARKLVEVESPIAGIVTSIDVSVGDYLQVGQKLATVAQTDKLSVTLPVDPDDAANMKIGQSVPLRLVDGTSATGKVTAVATSADPVTRRIDVKVTVNNEDKRLKPGLFVRAKFILRRLRDVVAIPRTAVVQLAGSDCVFLARGDTAEKRQIKLGVEMNGLVVVDSGLVAGDTLITAGQSYLDDGFKVRLISLDDAQ